MTRLLIGSLVQVILLTTTHAQVHNLGNLSITACMNNTASFKSNHTPVDNRRVTWSRIVEGNSDIIANLKDLSKISYLNENYTNRFNRTPNKETIQFELDNVMSSDAGVYKCELLSNSGKLELFTWNLQVLNKDDKAVISVTNLGSGCQRFTCSSQANPNANITKKWEYNRTKEEGHPVTFCKGNNTNLICTITSECFNFNTSIYTSTSNCTKSRKKRSADIHYDHHCNEGHENEAGAGAGDVGVTGAGIGVGFAIALCFFVVTIVVLIKVKNCRPQYQQTPTNNVG